MTKGINMRSALCAFVVALPLTAAAGPQEDAAKHVENGVAADQQGNFPLAVQELEAAYQLDPQPELLYALGQVNVKAGKCDVAIGYYDRFLATNPPPESASQVNEAITACRAQLAAAPPPPAPAPAPAPAPIVAPSVETTSAAPGLGLIVGAKLGGIVPLDGLSPFVHGGIEVGYVLPVLSRQLAIVAALDYTQPTTSDTEVDPRVTGGTYTWKLAQQELGLMAVLMYRATAVKPVIPYAGIGPRVLFTRSKVQDDGGPMLSLTKEQSTRIGVGIPVGVELPLGPGSAIGELLLQYGSLDHTATGDAHTGAITLGLGYRLFL